MHWRFQYNYVGFGKKGGNPKNLLEMNNFQNTIVICNMSDLGFSGNWFTWLNGWEEQRISLKDST